MDVSKQLFLQAVGVDTVINDYFVCHRFVYLASSATSGFGSGSAFGAKPATTGFGAQPSGFGGAANTGFGGNFLSG